MTQEDPAPLPEILVARVAPTQLDAYFAELSEHASSLKILVRGAPASTLEQLREGLANATIASAQLRYVRDDLPRIDTLLRRGDEFDIVRA